MNPQDDPILKRFRHELDRLYGERVERVVLFGSRARGDAQPDSDYDVAVFLKDCGSFWDEIKPMTDAAIAIMADTHACISTLPFQAGAYNQHTLLMHDMRNEGIDL